MIDVLNIREVEDNYMDKHSHFALKIFDKIVHLKIDNYDLKAKWISAIESLKNHYLFLGHRPTMKEYKKNVKDEIMLKIMAENESRNFEAIEVTMGFTLYECWFEWFIRVSLLGGMGSYLDYILYTVYYIL